MKKRCRKIKKVIKLLTLMILMLGLFCIQGSKSEAYGQKKVKNGFVYTTDTQMILDGFNDALYTKTITKKEIREYKKQFGKKKLCFILEYKGKKKDIRLPENIEGIRDYVFCISHMRGKKYQVENVTIPSNVNICSILYDDPTVYLEDEDCYFRYTMFNYKFHVEDGNPTLKSDQGLLYSRDGKILYGIPRCLKGRFVIPDGVEKVNITGGISLKELKLGKDVKKIFYEYINDDKLRKISVAKGNRYFVVKKNALYSRDMETLYFSLPKETGCYVMPKTVKRIYSRDAFYNTKYSKIVLSDQLKHIPPETFGGKNLKEIILGSNTETVGDGMWDTKIKELVLPKSVKWIYGGSGGPKWHIKLIVYNRDMKMRLKDLDESHDVYFNVPRKYNIGICSEKAKRMLERADITLEIKE